MRDGCDTAPGIDGFRLCNPPPILVALVKASLEVKIFFRFFRKFGWQYCVERINNFNFIFSRPNILKLRTANFAASGGKRILTSNVHFLKDKFIIVFMDMH